MWYKFEKNRQNMKYIKLYLLYNVYTLCKMFCTILLLKDVMNCMEHVPDYVTIGKNIRIARRAKGWTQARLADAAGCTPTNMTNIENAKTKLSLAMLIGIVESLGVSADEIIGISPDSKTDNAPSAESQLREIWSSLSYGDARICQQACVDFCKMFARHFPPATR